MRFHSNFIRQKYILLMNDKISMLKFKMWHLKIIITAINKILFTSKKLDKNVNASLVAHVYKRLKNCALQQ